MTETERLRAALIKIADLMGCDYDPDDPTDQLISMTVELVAEQEGEYRRWKQLYRDYTEATGHCPPRGRWRGDDS